MAPTALIWLIATVAHFCSAFAGARRLLPKASLDELIFATVIGGVASLSVVLHALAVSAGLSLSFGLAGLAAWQVVWWLVVRRIGQTPAPGVEAPVEIFDRAAVAVLLAVVCSWVAVASASTELYGPDAAHYHVPYAVNIAAGDRLFDLPATPHLYPMAGSVIAAWFIVPFKSTLLVDLAMVLPFAMMVAAINLLFRSLTDRSGTAWSSWLSLALFSTPLFRSASSGAADLWFAAGLVCVVAVVVWVWKTGRWTAPNLWLCGCAAGLLLGSKTTGAAALALLGAAVVITEVVRRLIGAPKDPERTAFGAYGVGVVMAIGAGGVWLIRNWIQFGSPVAPAGLQLFGVMIFDGETSQRTSYLSVLGEMQTSSFDLSSRSAFYLTKWLGPAFLPAAAVGLLMLIDLAATFRRRTSDARWSARAGFLILSIGSGVALVWLLIGAPWTALERSGGLTLRYALPVAALIPVVAFVSLFPLRFAWFERIGLLPAIAKALLAAGSVWMLWQSAAGGVDSAMPPIQARWLVAATAIVLLMARAARAGRSRAVVLLVAALGISGVLAYRLSEADQTERIRTAAAFEVEESAFAAGRPARSAWRTVFLAIRSDERARGASCPARRFFALVRNDEPMALQPPAMTSRSYYAGREVEAARRAGPIGPCDYVITTAALQQTGKGPLLVEALSAGQPLEPVQAPAQFVVLRLRQ